MNKIDCEITVRMPGKAVKENRNACGNFVETQIFVEM
jgi:hypothetical protein